MENKEELANSEQKVKNQEEERKDSNPEVLVTYLFIFEKKKFIIFLFLNSHLLEFQKGKTKV